MSHLDAIGGAIAVAFVGVVILIAIFGRRRDRRIVAEEGVRAKGLDAADMDETYAHQIAPAPSIEQVSRDKGAV